MMTHNLEIPPPLESESFIVFVLFGDKLIT